MIPNITRGGRARGLLSYLVTPEATEDKELHAEPHLVAGSAEVLDEWAGYDLSPAVNPSAARDLADWLDEPRVMTGGRVTVARKSSEGVAVLDAMGKPARADAHMWHCSLSLHPEEGDGSERGDEAWRAIASDFVKDMGFEENRWLALRHGPSAGGNDHVHVVVQLVGEDGRGASVHNDRVRAQERCRELEQRHGLRTVEGREAKRGARATNYRQTYRAEAEHSKGEIASPVPDRELLEARLRVAGAGAGSEAEFVRMLRADEVLVRPRFAAGADDEVVGYSVALPPPPGRGPIWHGGGKVAKDLTLPRLRSDGGWTAQDPEAVDEWQRAFRGDPPGRPPAPIADPDIQQTVRELRSLREAPDSATVARAGSACFYGWARIDPDLSPQLQRCGAEMGRSAQTRAAQPSTLSRPAPTLPLLAAAAVNPSNKTLWRLAMLQEMTALASATAAAHRAVGELQRADQLLAEIRGQLEPLRVPLEDAHAAVDTDYAAQLRTYRAAADTRRRTEIASGGAAPRPGQPPADRPSQARPQPLQPPIKRPGRGR
jgi:hypothetical protein